MFTLDTQYTCVFVGLKKGVEKTVNTIVEVIQRVKDAVLQTFGIVPNACFVSSEVTPWARASKLQLLLAVLVMEYSKSFNCALSFKLTVRWTCMARDHGVVVPNFV